MSGSKYDAAPLAFPLNPALGSVAAMALLSLSAVPSALAESVETAQAALQTEIIEVTGTRIKNADAASANPITVVTGEDIAKTSATTVEQVLKKLPAVDFAGGISSAKANGGNGDSVVGLRNLGAQRTLVLVDGLRMVATDNQASQVNVDLNSIPVQMIDHIDVLRDGASSIYGADAIGGVINIVLKKHFNGLEFDGDFGITDKSDGMHYGVSSTLGSDFDRGNILINVAHDHTDPIFQRDRDFSSDQHVGSTFSFPSISSRVPGVDAIIGGQRFYFGNDGQFFNTSAPPANVSSILPPSLLFLPNRLGTQPFFDPTDQQLLQGELDRNQVSFAAHYDILPHVTAVMDAFYTNRASQQQINPEPLGSNVATTKFPKGLFVPMDLESGGGVLPGDIPNLANPTVPGNIVLPGGAAIGTGPQDITTFLTRRFEAGDRLLTQDVDTYRLHFAFQGTLLDKYDWELGYVYGKSATTTRVFNEVNFDRAAQELGLSNCDVAGAKAAGLNGPASDPCLANFFGFNSLTPAQVNYLLFTNTRSSDIEQAYYYGNLTGPIYHLPAGDLAASIGFEYRNESAFDQPDSTEVQGDANSNASPTAGSYNVASGYIEMNVPVFKDQVFAKSLNLDLSTRYDYYSSFGRALTYKLGVDWAVTEDFRFRGSNETGFRAPQAKELFGGSFLNNPAGSDPCDTAGGKSAISAQCAIDLAKAGLSASQIATFSDKINQVRTIQGGNPGLKPERSQEWDFGGVFTPRQVPGLSLTVDYYTALVRNSIALANDPLNACETPGSAPSGLSDPCAGVIRTPGTGILVSVADPLINFGAESTDGIDLGLSYAFGTDKIGLPQLGGRISLDGQASYLLSDDFITNGIVTQRAGTYDLVADSGEPRWKAQLSGSYSRDNWSATLTERYYGGVKPDLTVQGQECGTKIGIFGCHAAGQFLTDVSATYNYKNMTATVGVDNLFDRAPPFLAGGVSIAQAVTGAGYDEVGRFIYTKVSIKF